jgi:hypothetical protein
MPEVPSIVHDVLQSPGQPLDPAIRAFMEPRFGHDFSQVRVHTDAKAATSARAVKALAYTVGTDIVFGEGRYSPGTSTGQRLLAHEIAHTLQQTKGAAAGAERISDPGDPAEQDADRAASNVMAGRKVDVQTAANGGTLHREPPEQKPAPPEQKPAPPEQKPAPPAPVAASTITKSGPATCDNGPQMFCNPGNKGCPKFKKGMTAAWANICYRCGPKGVFHGEKDEGTGVVRVVCGDTLTVTSQDNPDCSIEVKAIDHGPRGNTGNLVDLHPAAAEKLWKCGDKKAKGKFSCDNFKMPVSVSATENTCPA